MSEDESNSKLERILADYMRSAGEGKPVSRDDLLKLHPDLADRLQAFFDQYDGLPRTAAMPVDSEFHDAAEAETVLPASSNQPTADYTPAEGITVDGYRLVRRLGQGGMGQVWEAEHVDTGRRVALKLLSSDLSPSSELLERFIREARLAAALSHPRSTFVFGAGDFHGQPYIVMELMPGNTLQDVIDNEGPLPVNRAIDYVLDLIDGLQAAHRLGVIHRDVKPSNCFLDGAGRVKVGDFGLSKSLMGDTQLTRTGVFMGTPQFAAPEQIRGAATDERTDLYAVGVTLYCLIANRGPFSGDAMAMIAQVASDPPTPLRDVAPQAPRELERIVGRTLEKDPAKRYANLAELRSALLPFASGGTTIADIWRRLAGYMLDATVTNVCVVFFVFVVQSINMATNLPRSAAGAQQTALAQQLWLQVMGWLIAVGYFALTEYRWGCGIGKLLMGLRVVGPDGERAAFWRCLVRAVVIPGMFGVGFILNRWWLADAPTNEFSIVRQAVFLPLFAMSIHFTFLLVCISPMRARNGYRGLHELLSGTRVVRLRATSVGATANVPQLAPVRVPSKAEVVGPFSIVGRLGFDVGGEVLQAWDATLDRNVWIHTSKDESTAADATRQSIARSTRPHWLQGGETDEYHWDAFEPAEGTPFPIFLENARGPDGKLDWGTTRMILGDLANELSAALDDGTLPKQLLLDQVWVVRSGHIKLLDAPLVRTSHSAFVEAAEEREPQVMAAKLFREAFQQCTDNQILPDHVKDLRDGIAARSDNSELVSWAAQQLREIADRPYQLDWPHRVATLAVSLGTESIAYIILAFAVPLVLRYLGWQTNAAWVFSCIGISMMIPFFVGFAYRGSLVFRIMRISVCGTSGEPASRLRCGLRSWLAWLPWIIFQSLLGTAVARTLIRPENIDGSASAVWILLAVILGAAAILIHFLGAICTSVSPQRGLQDLLAGTRLIPR